MKISAIVATDLNNAIGKDNKLLWNLPNDLKFFKNTTMGKPVIMGRKTYDSMGRPLPGRRNIVITRDTNYKLEGVDVYHSIDEALKGCTEEEVFIIGGAQIFEQSLHRIDVLYRTLVKSTFDADTFFPEINPTEFKKVWEECHAPDEKNKYDYCFEKWERHAV